MRLGAGATAAYLYDLNLKILYICRYSKCFHELYILPPSLVPLLAMTTLVPRPPYTQDELNYLYPKNLKLQLVQIVCPSSFSPATPKAPGHTL